MNKIKIGIMGGTFDPIHNGHLIMAEYSRVVFGLEKVIFIPTGKPVHKIEKKVTFINYRYEMTLLAINSNPYFSMSPLEIQREGITYTIDTIKYLQSENNNVEYYFIMGSDSLFNFHYWKDYKELLCLCRFIVARRPDQDKNKLTERVEELNSICAEAIEVLEAPMIDISSTIIRNRIKTNLSIKYLVPESVELYIENNQLYRGNENDRTLDA